MGSFFIPRVYISASNRVALGREKAVSMGVVNLLFRNILKYCHIKKDQVVEQEIVPSL